MRMSSAVEASIWNELLPGEEVLWSGSPDPKSKGAVSSTPLTILGWVYTGLGVLFLMFIFILWGGGDLEFPFIALFGIGIFLFVIGLICLGVGYFFTRFFSQKVFYAITNRRVIILNGGRYLRVTSYNKRAITQVQRVERANGIGDLILVTGPYGAVAGPSGNLAANRHNTLMAVPNVREVERKLLAMLDGE